VGVWVGNADNTPMVDVSGISGAGPIWHEFMRRVLVGQPELEFQVPDGMVRAEVCATSGLLPTKYCPKTRVDWFIEGTVPTQEDNLYQPFIIDKRTGLLADDTTPAEDREERVFLVLPPEAREWGLQQGIPQPPVGAQLVGGETIPARLLSPDPYTMFRLTPLLPDESQRIHLTISVPTHTEKVDYWLDGSLLATITQAPFDHWWPLYPGDHELYAVVTLADGSTITTDSVPFRVGAWVPPDQRPESGTAE